MSEISFGQGIFHSKKGLCSTSFLVVIFAKIYLLDEYLLDAVAHDVYELCTH